MGSYTFSYLLFNCILQNRMHKSKTRRDKKHSWIYETLNITETSKIDNGDFRCTVSDNQGHVTSSSKNIKIYGKSPCPYK